MDAETEQQQPPEFLPVANDKPAPPQLSTNVPDESGTEEDMAPPELDTFPHQNGGDNHSGGDDVGPGAPYMGGSGRRAPFAERLTSDDAETGEDGEILEDGEIASDEGEGRYSGTGEEQTFNVSSCSRFQKDHC